MASGKDGGDRHDDGAGERLERGWGRRRRVSTGWRFSSWRGRRLSPSAGRPARAAGRFDEVDAGSGARRRAHRSSGLRAARSSGAWGGRVQRDDDPDRLTVCSRASPPTRAASSSSRQRRLPVRTGRRAYATGRRNSSPTRSEPTKVAVAHWQPKRPVTT